MILKFNLLPRERLEALEAESKKKYQFLKLAGIAILLTFLSISFTSIYLAYKIHFLKSIAKDLSLELSKYKFIAQKVKAMEKENKEIKQRILTILKLKKQQAQILKRLDCLLRAIDNNKIFFNNLEITVSRAQIKGVSMDLEYIANYLKNLERNKNIIKDVILKNTVKRESQAIPYIEFNTEIRF